jgi:uncharacterized protein YjbJ (UPF0337 family)
LKRKKQIKGKFYETAGKLTGDKDTEAKGKMEQVGGRAQEKMGNVKKKIRDEDI